MKYAVCDPEGYVGDNKARITSVHDRIEDAISEVDSDPEYGGRVIEVDDDVEVGSWEWEDWLRSSNRGRESVKYNR